MRLECLEVLKFSLTVKWETVPSDSFGQNDTIGFILMRHIQRYEGAVITSKGHQVISWGIEFGERYYLKCINLCIKIYFK